jgi:hypothetical protein
MIIHKAVLEDRDAIFALLQELRRSGYREMGESFVEVELPIKPKIYFNHFCLEKIFT